VAELDKAVAIIGRFQVRISARTLAMVTDDFHVFPQALRQIPGQYFKFGDIISNSGLVLKFRDSTS
jgi:hypothetical protein